MRADLPDFFAALTSRLGAAVAYFDLDGRYVFVNEALAAMNHLPVEAHLGRTVEEVLPQIAPQIRPVFAAVLAGETVTRALRGAEAATPAIEAWNAQWFPVRDADGAITGVGLVVNDVTDVIESHRAAAEAKADAYRRGALADFAQYAMDDAATLDAVLEEAVLTLSRALDMPLVQVLKVEPGTDEMTRLASRGDAPEWAEAPGRRSDSYVDFVMGGVVPVVIEDTATETRMRIPAQLIRAGVRTSIACGVRSARGPWGLISAHSLVPREFSDDELLFAQAFANCLSMAIREKEAQELHRDTVAMTSHELRTPLTSVIGLGQHLARRLRRSGAEESNVELVDALTVEAFKLDAIIDRWLAFAEMHLGLTVHRVERVDLGECVRRQTLAARERHPRMTIGEVLPDVPVELDTDRAKVAGVLDNLLENAARYAGESAHVEVRIDVVDERVRIAVHDDGPGIAPHNLPRLFERFYRGEGRIKGGLGVGLYSSRELAEEVGGMLVAASEPGAGATFTLVLPTVDARHRRVSSSAARTAGE